MCTLQLGKNLWLQPKIGSFGRYLNHSCKPNAITKGRQVIAIRDIKANEEVTIDYSITDDDVFWEMACKCKSKACRKVIKSVQFLPKSLFEKHKSIIPKFLRNAYVDKIKSK